MIQSLIRAMEILEILSRECRPYSLVEIAQAADLPPSTVHRMLQTFCVGSYVSRDESTHLYKLGPALVALGANASRQVDLRKAVMPELRTLTHLTGEDSYLVIKNGFKGLIVDKVEGPSQLKVVESFGYEQDLDVGGMRKVLLAFSSPEFIIQYREYFEIKHGLDNSFDLAKSLELVVQEGASVTAGEYIKEGIGVGAPIFDSKGDAIASLGIITPASHADSGSIAKLKDHVIEAGKRVSKNLGFMH